MTLFMMQNTTCTRFADAARLYTEAILLSRERVEPVLFSNRAAAHLHSDRPYEALQDASKCIEVRASCVLVEATRLAAAVLPTAWGSVARRLKVFTATPLTK